MEKLKLRTYMSTIFSEVKELLLDLFICENPDNTEKDNGAKTDQPNKGNIGTL